MKWTIKFVDGKVLQKVPNDVIKIAHCTITVFTNRDLGTEYNDYMTTKKAIAFNSTYCFPDHIIESIHFKKQF